jgi:transposase-like protein
MIEFKGSHFEQDVILSGVRWYVAYPISYRQLEELMEERGVGVDYSTLNRWVVKYVPLLDQQFRARKRPVGSSWRLDETYHSRHSHAVRSQSTIEAIPWMAIRSLLQGKGALEPN